MKSLSLINSHYHYLVGVSLSTTVLAWIGGTTRPSMAAQFFDITAVETGSLIDLPGSQTINGITYEGQTLPITGITANGASYLKRSDGTTAAERLFSRPFPDLFEYLVERQLL